MPHGGYHGTVVMGGNIIQQGDDKGGVQGGLGQAALNIPVNQPAQTAAQATAAAKAKEAEIAKRFPIQTGQEDVIISNVPGFDADDAKAARMQFQRENQILNNLLIAEQQAKNREGIIRAATGIRGGPGVLRKADLTGFEGGPFGLNIPALGATDSESISGIGTVRNPFTKQPLPTQIKAREGLTTPQYNQFIANLYNANPELFEETFPVASGNLAQPILARLLEGGLGGVGSGIGSFIDSATGAIFKPRGGTVRPSDVGAPSDTGGVTSVIDAPKANNNPFNIPSAFTGFYESDFYDPNAAGGQMIVPVTLPDGTVVKLPNTAVGEQFIQYLESLGISQPPATGVDKIASQPTGISKFDVDKFYASLPQYTQQGIMAPNLSRFTDALRMFPGATV